MRDWLIYAGTVVFVVVATFAVMYAVRLFSNATTPITLHQPAPGVTCAAMVTTDGAALSCWKERP
jgi:hypothetical protein